jgi:hypothetical protein
MMLGYSTLPKKLGTKWFSIKIPEFQQSDQIAACFIVKFMNAF